MTSDSAWRALDDMKARVYKTIVDRKVFKHIVESQDRDFLDLDRFGQAWQKRVREVAACINEGVQIVAGAPSFSMTKNNSNRVEVEKLVDSRFVLAVKVKQMEEACLGKCYDVKVDGKIVIARLRIEEYERPISDKMTLVNYEAQATKD